VRVVGLIEEESLTSLCVCVCVECDRKEVPV